MYVIEVEVAPTFTQVLGVARQAKPCIVIGAYQGDIRDYIIL